MNGKMQNSDPNVWVEGAHITCPKCGRVGVAKIETFRAKGRTYRYWTVRHYEGSEYTRCFIGRAPEITEAEAQPVVQAPQVQTQAPTPVAQLPITAFLSEEELDRRVWYALKVVYAAANHRFQRNTDSLANFVSIVQQAIQRTKVNTQDVTEQAIEAAKAIIESSDGETLARFNQLVKTIAKTIITDSRSTAWEEIMQRITTIEQKISEIEQHKIPAEGIERIVTRNDSRRGKVYVPADWIGRRVRVVLVE